MSFWDTSALGKLYLPEPDSPVLVQQAANQQTIVVAALARFEMQRVAFRKESEGLIPPGTAETVIAQLEMDIAAGEVRVVEIDARVKAEFEALMKACYRRTPVLNLRTFDAIHLATARVAGETEMVATDKRLREAALLVGLSVFP